MNQPATRGGSLGWALVVVQFGLLGILGREAAGARRAPWMRGLIALAAGAAGSAIVAIASRTLGRRLRAHPAPPEDAVLRTTGMYAVVRHPIYLGLLLLGVACTAIARTPRAAISLGALAVLFNAKSRIEERLLAERFPDYADYTRRVPRFLPRCPAPAATESRVPWFDPPL